MALLQDLIQQIDDPDLRDRILKETNKLAKSKKFGLVFENHLPECTPLYDVPIRVGSKVALKNGKVNDFYVVQEIQIEDALCNHRETHELKTFNVSELVVIAEFGEPIYPTLKPIDHVENAPDSDLWHTLIEADNYHALQFLEYLYAEKVDCIYIDPPYNTGAKDWKYNNDYVDSSDSYRHSKWLSMIEKRLKLAKKLLNPSNSVLIVTIDEKEYLHLGCLLEELFSNGRIQMVSSVISSQGSTRDGLFSRADEYIFFVFLGDAEVSKSEDDMLNEGQSATKSQLWFQFVRTGKGNLRENSKNLFYPIYINSDNGKIISIGESIPLGMPKDTVPVPEGQMAIWPLTADGREARWRTGTEVANRRLEKGLLRTGKTSRKSSGWSVLTVNEGTEKRIERGEVVIEKVDEVGAAILIEKVGSSLRTPKTVWNKTSHNAGWHGSKLLAKFLSDRKFPYPKSLYAVEDTLKLVTKKKNALIVDFFAGSGTTLHAVNLINAADNGSRRCILVTNNEVSDDEAKELRKNNLFPGDDEWEKYGIARYVTWPRAICTIKGIDIKGNKIADCYLNRELSISDGFRANAAFYKLSFLDKTSVALGRQFKELLPVLWMKGGAVGKCPELPDVELPYMLILERNNMAVLMDEIYYPEFYEKLKAYPDIQTVYIVTDSENAYREMIRSYENKECYQLYRDYLDNFRINTRR
ncbi:MAG: DNA methyltransferase [Proteocatella sp.]